jgi:hypothetical protein
VSQGFMFVDVVEDGLECECCAGIGSESVLCG